MDKKTNFRKFLTSSKKLVLAGRDAGSNEEVVKQAGKDEAVLHTKARGSPFCYIGGKASISDIKEAAVFCAAYSQAWKKAKSKKDVEVHVFKGRDIYKSKDMKIGTFGVKKFKSIIARKEDIEKFIKEQGK